MKIIKVQSNCNDKARCIDGIAIWFLATLEDGTSFDGLTCSCGKGCHGWDRLPDVGDEVE